MSSQDDLDTKLLAKMELQNLRKVIKKNEPKEIGTKILNPSDDSDWKMIKHFPKMSKKVKDSFRKYLVGKYSNLSEAGPSGPPYGNVLGNKWHKLLKDSIKGKEMTEYSDQYVAAAKSLFSEMKTIFGIELLESDFHLYGYMNDDSEQSQEVYFWRGNADAIGWWYNEARKKSEYVIVEWKVKSDLLNFWDSAETFGKFLHQSLLYARLLQVHLNLDYLPSVSIVPISGDNGKDVYPGLFNDYPDECKKWINEFSWHANAPVPLPLHLYWKASLFNDDLLKVLLQKAVLVKKDMPLSSIFKENTKVGELLEALGHDASSLMIHLLKDK